MKNIVESIKWRRLLCNGRRADNGENTRESCVWFASLGPQILILDDGGWRVATTSRDAEPSDARPSSATVRRLIID